MGEGHENKENDKQYRINKHGKGSKIWITIIGSTSMIRGHTKDHNHTM